MPKKSRRAKAKRRVRVVKVAQEERTQPLKPMSAEVQSPTRVSARAQDATSRYLHVIPELKRIGIIAGAIIVVLIILSIVLG